MPVACTGFTISMDTDELPPTQKGRQFELSARGLREFAGLRSDETPLNPFELAHYAKLLVVPFAAIDQLSDETRGQLIKNKKNDWSGGAASIRLPDGRNDKFESHARKIGI